MPRAFESWSCWRSRHISTITAPLTVHSVGLLGGIVMIRTSLSSSLETEIEGYWPWLRAAKEARSGGAGQANPSLSRQRFEGRFVNRNEAGSIVRISASEIENRITRAVGMHLGVQASAIPDYHINQGLGGNQAITPHEEACRLRTDPPNQKEVRNAIERVTIGATRIEILLNELVVAEGLDPALTLPWTRPSSRRRREIIQRVGEAQQPLRAMLPCKDDYFGQDVNIAARVQGLADVNEVCISATLMEAPGVGDIVKSSSVSLERRARLASRCRDRTGVRAQAHGRRPECGRGRRKESIGNGRRRCERRIARQSTGASSIARSFQRSDAS